MRKNVLTRRDNTTQFKQREAFYCNHVHCTTSICCLVADVGNSHWKNPLWNVWKMNLIICIHNSVKKSLPTLKSLITCKSDQEARPAISRARKMNVPCAKIGDLGPAIPPAAHGRQDTCFASRAGRIYQLPIHFWRRARRTHSQLDIAAARSVCHCSTRPSLPAGHLSLLNRRRADAFH